MTELNLPPYKFNIRENGTRTEIFDVFRKNYVVLTPEEWVRQNFLQYMIIEKKYPASLIIVEAGLKYNQLTKRADIVAYNKEGKPLLIVECKAPEVKITQDVFDQIARYNTTFKVKYLIVTNGINHFCCEMNYEDNSYVYLKDVPMFE